MGHVTLYEHDRIFVTKMFVKLNHSLNTTKTMKNVFTFSKPFFLIALFLVFIGSTAWQIDSKSKIYKKNTFSDTTKPGKHSTHKDAPGVKGFDQAMKELEEAMKKLEIEMKELDMGKIEREVKESMSKVDMKKIREEIRASMDKIDWNKMKEDIDKAMKEAEVSMKQIDLSKLEKEMAELESKLSKQSFDINIDAEKIKMQVEQGMEKAKKGMEKALAELKILEEFTTELEKDGLIDKKKGYKIQVKDGELYINGTKQSKEASDKYRKYYKKDNFTINTNGDGIIEI